MSVRVETLPIRMETIPLEVNMVLWRRRQWRGSALSQILLEVVHEENSDEHHTQIAVRKWSARCLCNAARGEAKKAPGFTLSKVEMSLALTADFRANLTIGCSEI